MSEAYIAIVVVICTTLGGGYVLYRRLSRNPLRNKKNTNILTLSEIAYMAAKEAELANREEQFMTHGRTIQAQMQELDKVFRRFEHERKY
jgi:hypothetical protein